MPQLLAESLISSLGPTTGMWTHHSKMYAILAASHKASLRGNLMYVSEFILVQKYLYIVIEAKTMPSPIVTLFSDRDSPYKEDAIFG
jgi:hypothetical protein